MANECNYPALMALRNKMAKMKTKKKEQSVFQRLQVDVKKEKKQSNQHH